MVMRLTLKGQLEFNEAIYRFHLKGAQYSFSPLSLTHPTHISLIEPGPAHCPFEITAHLKINPCLQIVHLLHTICLNLKLPLAISPARETPLEPETWVLSFKCKDVRPKLISSHQSRKILSPVRDVSMTITHHLLLHSSGQNLALFEVHPRSSAPLSHVPSVYSPPVLLTLFFIRILYPTPVSPFSTLLSSPFIPSTSFL